MIMRCAFIYNPHSGKCKQEKTKDYIVSRLKTKYDEVDVFPTQYAGHAIELARNSCGKYTLLVVAGGDGTLNEIVNGLAEQEGRPVVGYIPLGTVNDVGHSLHLSKNLKKAMDTILNGKAYKHDIFKVNDRYGIYVCCAGLFTETSYATGQKSKKKMGKVAYALHGAKKLFTTPSLDLKLTFDGGSIETKAAFLLILNSRNVASFGINKKAKLNDGLVDIMIIKEKRKKVSLRVAMHVLEMFLVGLTKCKHATRLRLNNFKVELGDSVVNIDGEKAGVGNFDFKVIQEGIEIIIGKKF